LLYWILWKLMYLVGKIALWILGGLRIDGQSNVPENGGVIVAPNHLSLADPVCVGLGLSRPAYYMASTQVFGVRVIRTLAKLLRAFPVKQDSPDRAALRRAEKLLEAGEAIVIFPEGHVTETAELDPIQPGVLMLAIRAGVPIVPVGIVGTERIVPHGKVLPRRSGRPVMVRFGKAIPVEELTGGMKGRDALEHGRATLAEAISSLVRELRQEEAAGQLARRNLPVS
jgi:1-acyl-sn-glycerol-3-phosphate acyltransferase